MVIDRYIFIRKLGLCHSDMLYIRYVYIVINWFSQELHICAASCGVNTSSSKKQCLFPFHQPNTEQYSFIHRHAGVIDTSHESWPL